MQFLEVPSFSSFVSIDRTPLPNLNSV